MTGIERLRKIGNDYAEHSWSEAGKGRGILMLNIADQIEREHACDSDTAENIRLIVGRVIDDMERHLLGHEGMEDSPVARWARELREALGGDEHDHADEREIIAWVREHGGLDAVKEEWNHSRNLKRSLETSQAKVGHQQRHIEFVQGKCRERQEHIVELNKMVADMRPRLMPEGMEWLVDAWPRFEGGEPVRFLDDFERYGEENGVSAVTMYSDGSFALNCRAYSKGERVNRPAPKVLDADGVEVEVGDDLYSVEGMLKFHVSAIDKKSGRIATEAMFALDKWADPKMYTHSAPVLAADGRPLRVGETVWNVKTGREYVVVEPSYGKTVVVRLAKYDDAEGEQYAPDQLTHERPGSKCRDCAHWQKDPTADNMGVCWFFYHEHEGQDCYPARLGDIGACEEFMPRASALAERERGE